MGGLKRTEVKMSGREREGTVLSLFWHRYVG